MIWTKMNWKGFGRKWSFFNQGTIPTLAWKAWGKLQTPGVPVGIWSKHILNTYLEHYLYMNLFDSWVRIHLETAHECVSTNAGSVRQKDVLITKNFHKRNCPYPRPCNCLTTTITQHTNHMKYYRNMMLRIAHCLRHYNSRVGSIPIFKRFLVILV
jgi:hypothetical protein